MSGDAGIAWDQIRVRINVANRVRCEPGWRLRPSWYLSHNDYDFWYVWAGRGWIDVNGTRYELRPGSCFWMRPGGIYFAEQELENRLGVSAIHFDLLSPKGRKAKNLPLPPEAQEMPDVPYFSAVLRRVWEISLPLRRSGDVDDEQLAIACDLLKCLLMEYDRAAKQRRRRAVVGTELRHRRIVQSITAQIIESPSEAPSVAEMAKEAGYSPDHFGRVFREITRQSPREFVVTARINRALQLLVETDFTISQIADALGYEDVYFFSKQFKQRTGITPTAYRKSAAGQEDSGL